MSKKPVKVESDEHKARRLWDEKLARDAQRVLDKAKICRCGHSKVDHKMTGLTTGPSHVCLFNFKMNPEGIKCDCPAFLLESVKG